jgi:hypothetical protein
MTSSSSKKSKFLLNMIRLAIGKDYDGESTEQDKKLVSVIDNLKNPCAHWSVQPVVTESK